MSAPKPKNEKERLESLKSTRLLDTPSEERFDRLTRMASRVFQTPLAALTFVDDGRQWFKSRLGFDIAETPRDQSICAHAILGVDAPFVVADLSRDSRFLDNPMVADGPALRFYAGVPVHGPGGMPVGALCVMDVKAHVPNQAQVDSLKDLAALASEEIKASVQRTVAARALESESELQDILDNAHDLVQCTLPEGAIVVTNRAWREAMGLQESEALGVSLETILDPPSRERWHDAVRRAQAGETVTGLELALLRVDGKKVIIQGALALRHGHLRGIFDNITVRRQREEELRVSEEQLRQAQKMEAVGSLAGGIAHDFNNILTVILGYGGILHGSLEGGDKRRQDVEEILKSGHRAAALTRQLLAFSRRQVILPKFLNLNAVVSNITKMLRRLVTDNIQLSTFYDPNLGSIKADMGQVEQVILNLVVNARDAMPNGGKVTIETNNVRLDETFTDRVFNAPPGDYVMLAVTDTGAGMSTEIRARIFEPFFTTKAPGKGTGMGLSTVYGIVKQSGGDLWVYSSPGCGAVFKIYFPRVDAPAENIGQDKGVDRVLTGEETILLVEDEEPVRAVMWQVLKPMGYRLLEADGPREALKLCQRVEHPIHLLITDVVMHGLIGRELAENLMPLYPEMRVLYVSGYTDDTVIQHGILEEGTHYLQKPFTPQEFLHKVREVLDAPKDPEV